MKVIQIFLAAAVFCALVNCSKKNVKPGVSVTQTGLILVSDSYNENSPANLYVVEPDGSALCYVTHDGNLNRNAGWSYDGTRIVYFTGNLPGIWTMDANGDNKKQLTFLPSKGFGPGFSPDGDHIVYSDYGAGEAGTGLVGYEVWVMNDDGTNPKQFTFPGHPTAPDANFPGYSPDGTKIVFL